MRKHFIIPAFICLNVLSFAAPSGKKSVPYILDLHSYLNIAVKNNPLVRRIQSEYASKRSSSLRTTSIKDLILTSSASFASTSGANNATLWGLQTSLSRTFPTLLGINAAVNLNYGTSEGSGGNYYSTKPSLGITLTIPLLYNSLGLIDKGTLKIMKLNLKILDKTMEEAYEVFLLSLYNAYFDWVLASEKAALFKGFMARALQQYNQTLRKRRYNIADAADVHLGSYNYQNYKTLYETEKLKAEQAYLLMLGMMAGKPDSAKNRKITTKVHTPSFKIDYKLPRYKSKISPDALRVVQSARLGLESAGIQLRSDTNATRPSLDLLLNANRDASSTPSTFSGGSFNQNGFFAGLQFSLNFQNSDAKHKLEASRHGYIKLQKEYKELLIRLSYGIRKYKSELERSLVIVKLKQNLARTAGYQVRASYNKYRQGRLSLNQLSDVYNSQARAKIDYLEYCIKLQKTALQFMALTDQLDLGLFRK